MGELVLGDSVEVNLVGSDPSRVQTEIPLVEIQGEPDRSPPRRDVGRRSRQDPSLPTRRDIVGPVCIPENKPGGAGDSPT